MNFSICALSFVGDLHFLVEDLSSIVYWLAHAEGTHRSSFYKILDQVVRANGLFEPTSKTDLSVNGSVERSPSGDRSAWTETKGALTLWTRMLFAGPYNPLRAPIPFSSLVEKQAPSQDFVARSSSISKLLTSNKAVRPIVTRKVWEEASPITAGTTRGQEETEISSCVRCSDQKNANQL